MEVLEFQKYLKNICKLIFTYKAKREKLLKLFPFFFFILIYNKHKIKIAEEITFKHYTVEKGYFEVRINNKLYKNKIQNILFLSKLKKKFYLKKNRHKCYNF